MVYSGVAGISIREKRMRFITAVLLLSAAALAAHAQERGRRGEEAGLGRLLGRATGTLWHSSIESATQNFKRGGSAERYIFVYVRKPGDLKPPTAFYGGELLVAGRSGKWTFAHFELNPEDPWQKKAGVSRAPVILGCDGFGNVFTPSSQLSRFSVKSIVTILPAKIEKYQKDLASELERASALAVDAPRRAVQSLIKLALETKPGYPQAQKALSLVNEIGNSELEEAALAESVSPKRGIEFLEGIVKTYGRTPPGVKAEIRIALLEKARGDVTAALRRLKAIEEYASPHLAAEKKEAARVHAEMLETARKSVMPPAVPHPKPSPAEQRSAETALRARFKTAYADRSLDARRALARTLLVEGSELPLDLPRRFVALREARDIAAAAGDVSTALSAADAMSAWFSVDAASMKSSILATASREAQTPEDSTRIAEALLELAREAAGREAFDDALQAARSAETAAQKAREIALVTRVKDMIAGIGELQAQSRSVQAHKATLEKKPDDAVANQEVGLFLCLVKGEWEKGLPHLVKAADAPLKALAAKDLEAPQDTPSRISTGDGWWDLAQRQTVSIRKTHALKRAAHWYRRASANLSGLQKLKVERRLEEIRAQMPSHGPDRLR